MAKDKFLTKNEIKRAVAESLKKTLIAAAANMKDLRSRELSKDLKKSALCPLCGNADAPGSCTCVVALAKGESFEIVKNATQGYPEQAAGVAGSMAMNEDCSKTGADPSKPESKDNPPTPRTDKDKMDTLFGKEPKPLHPSDKKKAMKKEEPTSHTFTSKPGKKESDVKTCATCGKPADAHMKKEEIPSTKSATGEKAAEGTVLPSDKKPKTIKTDGSGEIKKSEELRKDATSALKDAVFARKPLPKVSMGKAPLPGMAHDKAPHPVTSEGLADVSQAHNVISGLNSLSPILNHNKKKEGHGDAIAHIKAGLDKLQGAKPAAAPGPAAAPADAKPPLPAPKYTPAVMDHGSDVANLAADKKAAGIGWLHNLFSKFNKPKGPSVQEAITRKPGGAEGAGPVRSQASPMRGVRGMAALARSENEGTDLIKSLGDCVLCNKSEHVGNCPK